MSIVLRSRKTLAQRYRGVLKKYGTLSHLWDFGVPQGPLAYAATHTAAEFIAAHPLWPLWQDAAGTVPACKINDPVGLCKDQYGGAHASQATTTKRPILSGRVNLLTATEDFNNATYWSLNYASTAVKNLVGPNGLISGWTLSDVNSVSGHGELFQLAIPVANGAAYSLVGYVKKTAGAQAGYPSFHVSDGTKICGCTIDTSNGVATKWTSYTAVPLLATVSASCISHDANWWIVTLAFTAESAATHAFRVRICAYTSPTQTNGALTDVSLTGSCGFAFPDFRPANSPTNIPAYQRVTSATNYDTVGFPVRALFDGVDDCLVVPSLDLSMTDKVTVVAGVQNLSNASAGVISELGASITANPNTFALFSVDGTKSFEVVHRGSGAFAHTGVTPLVSPPANTVMAVALDISGNTYATEAPLYRVNKSTARSDGGATDTGTGNFSANPLNIGARNGGASLPFNGAIQSLAVIGNLLPDGEVKILEASANAAMGKVY